MPIYCFLIRFDSLYESTELKVFTHEQLDGMQLYRLPRVKREMVRMKKNMGVVEPDKIGCWWVDQRSFEYQHKRKKIKGNVEVEVTKQSSWMLIQILKEQGKSLSGVDINFRKCNQGRPRNHREQMSE